MASSIKEVWQNLTGRELEPKDVERLARLLAAAGIPQGDPMAPVLVALTAEYEAMSELGKRLSGAGDVVDTTIGKALAKATETAKEIENAAVARMAAAVADQINGKKIGRQIIAAVVAACLLTAGVSAGLSWYYLQRAGIEATASRNDLRRIAAEAASAALWATAGGKTDDPEVVDAWETISPRLAGLIADVPREKRANYIKNLDELTRRLTISSENGADKEDPSRTLSAVMVIAGIPQRNAEQIAKIASAPYFSCTAAPAPDTKSNR